MGIGGRLKNLWRATRDAQTSDPEQLRTKLDQTYRNQVQLLAQVRRGVADVTTSRKRVEVQLAGLRAQIVALDDEARQGVASGNDEAARTALTRKVTLEQAAKDLTERHAALRAEEDRLTASATSVERQIEDFRLKKDTLSARYSAASARAEIDAAAVGIASQTSEIGQAMSDAERHTRELEATSAALDELMAEGIVARPGENSDEALSRTFDQALGAGTTEGSSDGPHEIQK
jgi:phage shock protein A